MEEMQQDGDNWQKKGGVIKGGKGRKKRWTIRARAGWMSFMTLWARNNPAKRSSSNSASASPSEKSMMEFKKKKKRKKAKALIIPGLSNELPLVSYTEKRGMGKKREE